MTPPSSVEANPASGLGDPNATDPNRNTLRLASGAMTSFGATLVGRLLTLVSQIVFAKLLGVEDYGRFALGMVTVRLFGTIAPLGMGRAAVVFGSRHWKSDDQRFKGLALTTVSVATISGCVIGLGALLIAANGVRPPAFADTQLGTLALFAAIVPAFALLRVLMELTLVSQQVRFRAIAENIVQPVVALLGFVAFYFLFDGLTAVIVAAGLSYTASCSLGAYFVLTLFRQQLSAAVKASWEPGTLARFAGPVALATSFGVTHSLLDRLLVGALLPASDMAVYQAASQGAVAFMMIVGSIGTIFTPLAASAYSSGDSEGLARLFRTSSKWGLYVALPLFVVLQLEAGPILGLTFGAPYRAGGAALSILAFGQLVNVSTGSVGAMLLSSGNQFFWMIATGAGVAGNALVGIALIDRLGIQGAALANLTGSIILFGGATIFARYRLGIWPFNASFWKLFASAAIAFSAGFAMSRIFVPGLAQIGLVALAVFTGFAATVWALGVEDEERQVLSAVRRRIRSLKGSGPTEGESPSV